MKKPLRIAITTGDADGIGPEVTAKALSKLKPRAGVFYQMWRSPRMSPRELAMIDRNFKRITVSSWPEALKVTPDSSRQLIDINTNLPPAIWVQSVAEACSFGHLDAMVTAPLSKTAIISAGLQDMGHTGILKRVTKSKELFMGFIGDKFNVLLATGHIPISDVSSTLTESRLLKAIRASESLRRVLDTKFANRPLALLGLNPHSGEEGLIGQAEMKIHSSVIETVRSENIPIEGPLVPDAAFFNDNWSKYSVYVANYHDQGLIPFKMIHGQESGIQVTMGLPFVRTSVDHGTAKDLFGKNKADPSSMRLALDWADRLARSQADLTLRTSTK